jgi:glycosyltransferase involved in cell wall biosynthesis
MRIWIVNHYAGGPGIGTGWRHWELARRWIGCGGDVRILAAATSIGGRRDPRRSGIVEIDAVRFHFIDTPGYGGNGIGRLRNMLAFSRGVGAEMSRLARDRSGWPDVVIASSPHPLAWTTAIRAVRRTNATFVAEMRDLWPESLIELGGLPAWHPMVLWCRRADAAACRSASVVFSPLDGIGDAIRSRGHAGLRSVVVPNGVSMQAGDPPPLDADAGALTREARSEGRRLLLYPGAMGVPNALDQLVDALEMLPDAFRRRLLVLMVGDGSERPRLQAHCSARGLPVRFMGPRGQDQVRALCRACDAGFIGWLDRPLYRFGIAPQKRALMLGEGLPVLHAVPHCRVDEEALGTGWSVPAGDVTALSRALKSLFEASDARLASMRAAAQQHARQRLDWDRIAADSWQALESAVARRNPMLLSAARPHQPTT